MDSSKSHDADGSFFTRSNARILLRGKYVLFMGGRQINYIVR